MATTTFDTETQHWDNSFVQKYAKADAEITQRVMAALNNFGSNENVGISANTPHSKRPVCIVAKTIHPYGWENGNWMYLETRCGRRMKHHAVKRNCLKPGAAPNCIGCLAE